MEEQGDVEILGQDIRPVHDHCFTPIGACPFEAFREGYEGTVIKTFGDVCGSVQWVIAAFSQRVDLCRCYHTPLRIGAKCTRFLEMAHPLS